MSSKFNKLFRKWSCFGGKAPSSTEDEVQNKLRMNQPKIVITKCNSVGTSPTFSRQSSSASGSSHSNGEEDEEAEVFLITEGEEHRMGMNILVRTKSLDETDGGHDHGDRKSTSLVQVMDVNLGSFAHGFGLREGDMISKVNGQKCGNKVLGIKEAFKLTDSNHLTMEILRKYKDTESGDAELLQMTLCSSRHMEGEVNEELIININNSSWSLSDTCTYYKQDEVLATLQFESEGSPWIVPNRHNQLTLATNLSEDEVNTNAGYCISRYWCHNYNDTGIPVVIQHAVSRRCVALVDNTIRLVEVANLDEVHNQSIIFSEEVPADNFGVQVVFRSTLDKSCYIGFKTQGRAADGQAVPIHIENGSTFEEQQRNVIFLEKER